MIDIKVKTHDRHTFEFKISFIVNQDEKNDDETEFSINTWLFVPNSLDINRTTYSKEQFYKDVTSNVRLLTPKYNLKNIHNSDNGLIKQLKAAFVALSVDPDSEKIIEDYAYHIRMFLCICKSAIRESAYYIIETRDDDIVVDLIDEYIKDVNSILKNYRTLWIIINTPKVQIEQQKHFFFGDEFLGNILEQQTFRLMRGIEKRPVFEKKKQELNDFLDEEIKYKTKKDYIVLDKKDTSKNYLAILRRGILKKFIESDLYLNTKKSKDGAFVEQFYYGIAAGVSMIFATVIAFTAQMRFGNLTTPLFLALVVSYIFKDRIKDLMRYYFSTQLGKKYYDTKRELEIRNDNIGWTKEAFDFVSEEKVPSEVLNLRMRTPLVEAENKIFNEKILLYKKLVNLSLAKINKNELYEFDGINDITRFNVNQFVLKMDDSFISLYVPDKDKGYDSFDGEKIYTLHFVIRCQSKNELYYRTFRLLFNRDGIKDILEMKN